MVKPTGLLVTGTLVFSLFLFGCQEEELTEEEEEIIDEAIPIAEEMFDLRADEELYESDLEALKEIYTVYTTRTEESQIWWTAFDEKMINTLQRATGGVEEYELVSSKVGTRLLAQTSRTEGHYVKLTYKVSGPKGETKEVVGLWKVHPDADPEDVDRLNANNEYEFRIIYHAQTF